MHPRIPRGGGQQNSKCRVSGVSERSPDSDSPRKTLQKSGLASHVGPQKCDVASRGGGPLPEVLPVPSDRRFFRNERQELCIIVVRLRTLHHTPGLVIACKTPEHTAAPCLLRVLRGCACRVGGPRGVFQDRVSRVGRVVLGVFGSRFVSCCACCVFRAACCTCWACWLSLCLALFSLSL
jgi:hypothetical protein